MFMRRDELGLQIRAADGSRVYFQVGVFARRIDADLVRGQEMYRTQPRLD